MHEGFSVGTFTRKCLISNERIYVKPLEGTESFGREGKLVLLEKATN